MMKENAQHFRHFMLYYFKKGKHATEMPKKFCAVYRKGAMIDTTCHTWFGKFCTEISRWTMVPGRVDQLKLTASYLRH